MTGTYEAGVYAIGAYGVGAHELDVQVAAHELDMQAGAHELDMQAGAHEAGSGIYIFFEYLLRSSALLAGILPFFFIYFEKNIKKFEKG
jgi:hypothetical protein